MESASWQRPLYGFEISQNQAKMPLKSGFSDGLGGGKNLAARDGLTQMATVIMYACLQNRMMQCK